MAATFALHGWWRAS
ncbi:trp operon leader peptide [Salmonella enterica]|nr:trp operon leader peptide [Salmonella enterica]